MCTCICHLAKDPREAPCTDCEIAGCFQGKERTEEILPTGEVTDRSIYNFATREIITEDC